MKPEIEHPRVRSPTLGEYVRRSSGFSLSPEAEPFAHLSCARSGRGCLRTQTPGAPAGKINKYFRYLLKLRLPQINFTRYMGQYVFKDTSKEEHRKMFQTSENLVKCYCRAKYYRTPDGKEKLVQIQSLGVPSFRRPGFEKEDSEELDVLFDEAEEEPETLPELPTNSTPDEVRQYRNRMRNLRRAKINAFDKILANPDLDTFCTFTISPEMVDDRTSWSDVYRSLRMWLSNRVTRSDLKYVICPERHKAGGIHFHGILNRAALNLTPAHHAQTGQALTHRGNQLYNISDFRLGFTSAEIINTDTLDREKVAKYIFKYMGKQGTEGRIGGRYALIGGRLYSPYYRYGNDPGEFMPENAEAYYRTSENNGITYCEWSYI